jgi:beta-lactamase regulating signal transducer with metallopeptidase domain
VNPFVLDLPRQWRDWIAPLAWQATLVGALALAVDRSSLRRRRPEIASAAWLLFFARLALPPSIASPLSISRGAFETTWTPIERGVAFGDPWIGIAFAAWGIGALALLARSLSATLRFRRALELDFEVPRALGKELVAASSLLGVRRIPRLALANELESPLVVGLFRPLVVLPRELDPRTVRHALLHELAHVRRKDLAARAVVEVLTALFWFHPLAWIGASRLARARELLCDARVAEALGPEREAYRASLARAAYAKLVPGNTALAFRSSSRILERLAHLERPVGNGALRRLGALGSTLAAGFVLLPMASRDAGLAAIARSVLEKAAHGERESCFALHAAARLLQPEQALKTPDSQGDRR